MVILLLPAAECLVLRDEFLGTLDALVFFLVY